MFKLDDNFLIELGLGSLPPADKNKMLSHIYETLEMRIGMRLAERMSNEQLDEFESFIKQNNEQGALKWLEANFPNYKQVVAEELEKLKGEIRQVAPQIVQSAMSQQSSQQPQQQQQPQQSQPQSPQSAPAPQQQYAQPQQQQQQPQQYSQFAQQQQVAQQQPAQAQQQSFSGPQQQASQQTSLNENPMLMPQQPQPSQQSQQSLPQQPQQQQQQQQAANQNSSYQPPSTDQRQPPLAPPAA